MPISLLWRAFLDRTGNEVGLCVALGIAASAAMLDPSLLGPASHYEAGAWALAAAAVATGSVWMLSVYLIVEVADRAYGPSWVGVAPFAGGLSAGMMAVATFVAVGAALRAGLPAFAPNLLAFSACAAAPPLLLCRLSLARAR